MGAPIDIVSTGPDREETIVLRDPFGNADTDQNPGAFSTHYRLGFGLLASRYGVSFEVIEQQRFIYLHRGLHTFSRPPKWGSI